MGGQLHPIVKEHVTFGNNIIITSRAINVKIFLYLDLKHLYFVSIQFYFCINFFNCFVAGVFSADTNALHSVDVFLHRREGGTQPPRGVVCLHYDNSPQIFSKSFITLMPIRGSLCIDTEALLVKKFQYYTMPSA